MKIVRAAGASGALGMFVLVLACVSIAGCGEGGDDGPQVKTVKGAKSSSSGTSGSAGSDKASDSNAWVPTAKQVMVSGDRLLVWIYGCGKECSVISKRKPTKFEYGQSSTKMWQKATFPLPDTLGPGKHTWKIKLNDKSYGDATVEASFAIKKAFFDGTDCKHAKCKYEHSLNAVKVFGPAGTKVKLGSIEKTVVKDKKEYYPWSHTVTFPIDGMKYFLAYEKGDKSAGDKKEPLVVTLPSGQVLKTTAYVAWRGQFYDWLDKRLDKAKPGTAVPVPGESKNAPRRPRGIQVYPGSKLLGGKMVDRPSMIDEVAYYKATETKRYCGTYVNRQWGTRYKSYMTYHGWIIDIYDRRTGRKKLRKVLRAKRKSCPKKVAEPPQGQTEAFIGAEVAGPKAVVFEFLKKRLAKKR